MSVVVGDWNRAGGDGLGSVVEKGVAGAAAVPDLQEEVPVTEIFKTPPPIAPPAAPAIIEIVEDTDEIEETIIQSTETNQEAEVAAPIISVDEVEVEEIEEEITVPFAVIEDIPVFPGCEQGSDKEKRACFQQKVQEHVKKNFRYPDIAVETVSLMVRGGNKASKCFVAKVFGIYAPLEWCVSQGERRQSPRFSYSMAVVGLVVVYNQMFSQRTQGGGAMHMHHNEMVAV